MTINITFTMPNYIIQVSDRRMVSVPSGKPYNDEANKGIIIRTDNGIFSIIFSGIGIYNNQRVDLFLVDHLLDAGAPELPASDVVNIISKFSTVWFNSFPKKLDRRHTFTLAGWEYGKHEPTPLVWRITNCVTENGETLQYANDSFDTCRIPIRRSEAGFFASGLTGVISRQNKESIQAALRAHANAARMEEVLVDIIKKGASNPKWSWGINNNVLSVLLASTGEIQATHCSERHSSSYIPPVLWHEAGRNYVAGDGWVSSSKSKLFQFGPMTFIAPPSTPTYEEDIKIDFKFKFYEAKHKSEPLGDLSLVKVHDIK